MIRKETFFYIHTYICIRAAHTIPLFCMGGVYRGVMTNTKWLGSRKKERWDDFAAAAPSHSKSVDKVPNWARKSIGLNSLGRVANAFPLSLQQVTDEILLQRLQLGMELSPAGISDLIHTLLKEYNQAVLEIDDAIAEMDEGEKPENPVPPATCTLTKGNLDKLAGRFARRFNWSYFRNEKPGKHLDFNNQQVASIRNFIATAVKTGRVHERLVANWDQVWTLTYEPLKRVAFKQLSKPGLRPAAELLPTKAKFMNELRTKAGLPPLPLGFPMYVHTYIIPVTHVCVR